MPRHSHRWPEIAHSCSASQPAVCQSGASSSTRFQRHSQKPLPPRVPGVYPLQAYPCRIAPARSPMTSRGSCSVRGRVQGGRSSADGFPMPASTSHSRPWYSARIVRTHSSITSTIVKVCAVGQCGMAYPRARRKVGGAQDRHVLGFVACSDCLTVW